MLSGLLNALEWLTGFSDPLAWLVLATFVTGAVLEWRDHEWARPAVTAGWGLFGVFWFTLIHHFTVTQRSIIEGIGSVAAVPLSLYAGYLLWNGRDSLFVLSRAVAVMGLVFFPFETVPLLKRFLVELVTGQVDFLVSLTGAEYTLIRGDHPVIDLDNTYPYENTFYFQDPDITYSIILACTGIGSMSIFAGLIVATPAPLRRKIRALAVSLPVIYGLNLLRNVVIAVGFGEQRFHIFPNVVMSLFAIDDPLKVSYYIIDRIAAQSLSVVALLGITYLVVRELPEVLVIIEDLLYLVTGTEYDLRSTLDVSAPTVRADGGD
jgi:archaeosortase A (PGF-CTERM-specific)